MWHHRERYFYVSATCVVCQTIPVIVHVHVHVVKSCLLCKFEFVQCSACFFDQAFCFCPTRGCWNVFIAFIGTGILCSGYMCSLPSHPCHSSCISSCCDVLLHCLILGLYHAVHGFLTKLEVWYYIVFPTRGCWKVLWYCKNRHVIYFGYM